MHTQLYVFVDAPIFSFFYIVRTCRMRSFVTRWKREVSEAHLHRQVGEEVLKAHLYHHM